MITLSKFSQQPTHIIGFFQALGVAAYVTLFASVLSNMENVAEDVSEVVAGIFFMLMFIFSALVCGSLVLGHPILLALQGKTKRAVEIVFWSGASIMFFLVVILAALFALSQ